MLALKVIFQGKTITESFPLHDGYQYTVGRDKSCSLVLDQDLSISRQHFQILQNESGWFAQVISPVGRLLSDGLEVRDLELQSGCEFSIAEYSFLIVEADTALQIPADESGREKIDQDVLAPRSAAYIAGSDDDDSDGMTVVRSLSQIAQLKLRFSTDDTGRPISLRGGSGTSWVAGRDQSCYIHISDSVVSKRQFEIELHEGEYFIHDLGSSNGTSVNGKVLPPHDLHVLTTGDVIGINHIQIEFNLYDEKFAKRLLTIEAQERANREHEEIHAEFADENSHSAQSQPSISTPPVDQPIGGNGGAIAIHPGEPLPAGGLTLNYNQTLNAFPGVYAPPNGPGKKDAKKAKVNTRTLIMAGVVGALILGAIVMQDSSDNGTKAEKQLSPKEQAFALLKKSQKQEVKDTYNLAKNLRLQNKFALAVAETEKIHKILPLGYLDSKDVELECRNALTNIYLAEQAKAERERQEAQRKRVAEILFQCDEVARRTIVTAEIQSCLYEAIELDPNNTQIQSLIARVEMRAEEERQRKIAREKYLALVNQGRGIYQQANAVYKEGRLLAAIAAFEKFLKTDLPDPDNNRDKAERNIASIKTTIETEVDSKLKSAGQNFEGQKYKEALVDLGLARKIDPNNEKIASLTGKTLSALNKELREVYELSIIYEGLGQIENARKEWRKILERDRADGDYMKRVKTKMRMYGNK